MKSTDKTQVIHEAAESLTINLELLGHVKAMVEALRFLTEHDAPSTMIKELAHACYYLAADTHNLLDCDREKFVNISNELEANHE